MIDRSLRRTLVRSDIDSAFNSHTLLTNHYDYIITGAGCAGLSLLYRMIQHPFFIDKQILVIDQSPKNNNDRTWCFWEQQAGVFEEIVHHRWKQIDFYSTGYLARFDLEPYEYKMIRGIDFYNCVLEKAKQKSNIHFYYGKVQSLTAENNKPIVKAGDQQFEAGYIFNSILFYDVLNEPKGKYNLLQHFKGWLIETPTNVFNEHVATFMDFRVSQNHGTTFAYMLPVSPNIALVEYTLFTEKLLQPHEYDEALKQYIETYLEIRNYAVAEEEFGVIPMTDYSFSKAYGNIINIGTAGGQTKASSGFTFQFIQKQADAISNALVNNNNPHIAQSFSQRRFGLYDSVLLNILQQKKMGGDKIFEQLFKKNPPLRVLKFLDNETNFSEELKIMGSVPAAVFLPAAFNELLV